MGRFDIGKFSYKHKVKKIDGEDIEALYQLCLTNPMYYEYCDAMLTKEDLQDDLFRLPPGKELKDKYYVGFWDKDVLVAVLDLIDGFPDCHTAYLGFFMVDGRLSGKGRGSDIMKDLFTYLALEKVGKIRLGHSEENPQAAGFWKKQGFTSIGKADHEYGKMIICEKTF